jgi:hypothetical protein
MRKERMRKERAIIQGEGGENEEEKEESVNPTYCVLDVIPCNLVEIYRRVREAVGS